MIPYLTQLIMLIFIGDSSNDRHLGTYIRFCPLLGCFTLVTPTSSSIANNLNSSGMELILYQNYDF